MIGNHFFTLYTFNIIFDSNVFLPFRSFYSYNLFLVIIRYLIIKCRSYFAGDNVKLPRTVLHITHRGLISRFVLIEINPNLIYGSHICIPFFLFSSYILFLERFYLTLTHKNSKRAQASTTKYEY